MITPSRRALLTTGTAVGLGAALSACSSQSGPSGTASSTTPPSPTAAGATGATGAATGAATPQEQVADFVPSLEELTPLAASFTQSSYVDEATGKTLPFNVFLPQGYEKSGSYPLVHYIADASQVSTEVTTPLSQYGALIWAHSVTQDLHQCIVVVPCYPETVLDDHNGYVTTDWIDVTRRFIPWLQQEYAVDPSRVYGTGQSMGCMIHLLLQGTDLSLFTACMFVDGQWDTSQLAGLGSTTWVYHVAGGDERALAGQTAVKAMLTTAGVDFAAAEGWDATASVPELNALAQDLLGQGKARNFSSFAAGTVLEGSSVTQEHMASFEPAYKLNGLRSWLLAQRA